MAGASTKVDVSQAMITHAVPLADWLIVAPSLITIIGGCLCLLLRKKTHLQSKVGLSALFLLVLANAGLLIRVKTEGVLVMVMGNWLPPFGITFAIDMMGATLSLIASVVAFCTGIYGSKTFDATGRRYGFYPFLLLLLTGVSGAFLTGDIFNLYVWFEVLLISSYGLLVLGNTRIQLDGTVKYGILNLVGTNFFLIATGLLYGEFGTLNMADIARKVAEMGEAGTVSGPLATIAGLYLLAFAMKGAAFPVNFWLPASYHTPNIAVSALFAGLLTKVGVYALLRIFVLLLPGAREYMDDLISLIAIATMIMGGFGALAQNDLRRLLGYVVIVGIGAMLAGLAVGSVQAIAGAIFYAVHSIIVMTALYMAAGMMSMSTGSYILREMGGLYGARPTLAAVFLILVFAVSGLPPFSGFWPKVMLLEAAWTAGRGWLATGILLSGFLTMVALGRVWIYAFWRGGAEGTPDGETVAKTVLPVGNLGSPRLWLPLSGLTVLVIVFGLDPEPLFSVVSQGAESLLHPQGYIGAVFGGAK